ncbi:MAG TPA: dihydrodipicolinate synthase family protein [Dongiaceae bacterium]|nr:dihydrodipicolinate synthase family protein [Dongiaceae bacterium]
MRTEGFARLRDQFLAGNNVAAREIWHGLIDLIRLLFAEPNPAPVKFCLWQQGLIASPEVRLPMTEVTTALAARLSTALTSAAAA